MVSELTAEFESELRSRWL